MADEPNNKMDEALKAYARKRREDATPLEMHPATRQMLQAEVARVHRRSRSGQRSWWITLLPRMGFALSIAIVLAVVFWSTRSPSPRFQLAAEFEPVAPVAVLQDGEEKDVARSDVATREEEILRAKTFDTEARLGRQLDERLADRGAKDGLRNQTVPMPATMAANEPLADQDILKRKTEKAALDDASGSRGVAPAAASPTLAQVEQSDFNKKLNAGQPTDAVPFYRIGGVAGAVSTNAVLAFAQSGTVSTSSEASARANTEAATLTVAADAAAMPSGGVNLAAQSQVMRFQAAASTTSEYRDRFRRTDSRSEATGLMENFELQQLGNQVRVVDQDGSVYNGVVTPQTDPGRLHGDVVSDQAKETYAEAEKQDAARALRTPATITNRARLAFTASGTNRTLNQPVFLSGALVPEPTVVSLDTKAGATAPSRPRAAAQEPRKPVSGPSTGEVLRFRGQLRVGRTNQMAIDALRVSP